nr:Toll/interleukin-1 receptor (TIR) domain-containing protein [Tanacetum cinerariifolium]
METKDTLPSCSNSKEQQMQQIQDKAKKSCMEKVDTGKALDASLVNTESSGIESGKQDTSSSSGNDVDADDADIKPVYVEEPMAEKCVFNANHDSCVTKFLKEVNSRTKVPSNKTTNRNKPIEQTSVAMKPERQILIGHMFSIKKTLTVYEKTMIPRSCLRWQRTGRIFKTIGLRWVPTEKIFDSSTTKVDSEPPNGSNEDITNPYKCEQTLNVSSCTFNLSSGNLSVSKSSALFDNLQQHATQPTVNIHPISEPRNLPTTVNVEENILEILHHCVLQEHNDVEPTEVCKQTGLVREAFTKHEHEKAAGKWREALEEAADLAGWESKKTANRDESKLIQIIVDDIFQKLSSIHSSVDRKLVGMERQIEAFLSSLEHDSHDVHMIGIWGMGGGGKTTLARAAFDRISFQFDGVAFVENVREVSKSSLYGLNKLQEQILHSALPKENITVSSVHEGTNMMKKMMRGTQVLIVLDDVDDTAQLEALAGEPNWFKFGSMVIITTRDKQVLLAHRVKFINDVNLLSHTEAISLFSKYAFNRDIPIEGYEELSEQVVQYADGLPLTIKVLGSLLYGQSVPQWIDTLERLKKIPLKATMQKLELSYIDLEEDYKEKLLDVACILKGWDIDDAITALESCGFFAEVGLEFLNRNLS